MQSIAMKKIALPKAVSGFGILISILFVLACIVTVYAVVPQWRTQFREFVFTESREVLARATSDITGNGDRFTFIKVRDKKGLSIEVYNDKLEGFGLQSRLSLNESRDGFFDFRGQATNMALADIDNDGVLELLVPTFDENLIARLNVFKFNSDEQTFERLFNTEGF
jgi:hypothetical protein